ncbi:MULTISPECIES: F0F1 ATP synthase subunit delta [unclassified Actinomyces]|uniref:F0F1 ATP synthase subunit delta n=1 Tax=unclassified Actinomyces TaxID=2609248 RepID=UPI0013A6E902|nr:F0F1 ATP synthase subunit delta [Actinomyces sp. 594]MBW3068776.1 F0F1 ATP synthase subunit delta [Actinomyces sp. 594]NDR54510.1 F0F1 ATP synthase subunit delta [Actinomyces sp. 565]
MKAGTSATRALTEEAWAPVLAAAGAQGQQLGEQILAVAHEIASNPLRGPLTDPNREPEDKAALAARLFTGRADERVVELLQGMVRGRWSRAVDLISALHDLGIQAILSGAQAGGTLDDVEQEVFAVAREVAANREIRQALEPARRTSTDARVRLAHRLFASRISHPAMTLVAWCVRHQPEVAVGGVPYNLRRVTELAAGMQNRVIADVVTAVPLTTAQQARLRAILVRRLGFDVELNLEVDPEVIGGVRVVVRDLVMDSTMRHSLAELRGSLTG